MRKIKNLLTEFAEISSHPRKILQEYLKAGEKVIGCFPPYTPQPLVTAAGMVPMGLWGGQCQPMVSGKYSPIFTCSIMRSCLEYGMTNVYAGLSAALMPIVCDTFRGMSSAWRMGVPDIPLIVFAPPQNRQMLCAREYFVEELQSVKRQLEKIAGQKIAGQGITGQENASSQNADKKIMDSKICGQESAGREITEEALQATLELYNRRNAVMREFAGLANQHLDIISPSCRHQVMKAATFLKPEMVITKVGALNAALKTLPIYRWQGKKVVLAGILVEDNAVLKSLSDNKIAVVGDDLSQESQQYRVDYPQAPSAMESLALHWFALNGASLAHDENNVSRGELLLDMVRKNNADGLILGMMRFCDIEEYDQPYILKLIQTASLPALSIEIDQSTAEAAQSVTKIQAFGEG